MAKLSIVVDHKSAHRGIEIIVRDLRGLGTEAEKTEAKTDRLGKTANENFRKMSRSAGLLSRGFAGIARAAAGALTAIAGFAGAALSFRTFISNTIEAQRVQNAMAAAIVSTGGAARQSLANLNQHAAALQKITTFGDETINSAQALLLTFTNIKGDTFKGATEAVLNVATAMQLDLKSAAIQVGKALNDPITGMNALSRSGITFSQAQKETVKQLVQTGRTAEAQKLILKELETQFGGAAEAARQTLGGALAALRNQWGDLFELSSSATSRLRSAIEQLIVAISNPAFVGFVQMIGTALVNALTVAARAMGWAFDNLRHLYDLFKLFVAARIVVFITAVTGSMIQMAIAIKSAGLALAFFSRISRVGITGLVLVAGVVAKATGHFDDFADALRGLWERAQSLLPESFVEGVQSAVDGLEALALGTEDPAKNFATYISAADDAAASFGEVGSAASTAGDRIAAAGKKGKDAWKGLREPVDRAREAAQQFSNVGSDVTRGFVQDLRNGVSASEAFANALTKISDALLDDVLGAIFQVRGASRGGGGFLSGLFGGLFGGGGGIDPWAGLRVAGFAKGAAFNGGRVIPFAKGGVVSQPTFFPMAGGNTGLMSERSSEAIMPLHRGADGSLGVRAANQNRQAAAPVFNIHISLDGAKGEEHLREVAQEAVVTAISQYDKGNTQRVAAGYEDGRSRSMIRR